MSTFLLALTLINSPWIHYWDVCSLERITTEESSVEKQCREDGLLKCIAGLKADGWDKMGDPFE